MKLVDILLIFFAMIIVFLVGMMFCYDLYDVGDPVNFTSTVDCECPEQVCVNHIDRLKCINVKEDDVFCVRGRWDLMFNDGIEIKEELVK